jgi:hypothetical protein
MVYSNNFGQTRVGVRVVTQVVNAVDADATAFIAAAGITNLTQAAAISTLVDDLKAYGLWTKMKALYPFVGGSAASHKWNLKDPRDLDAAYRLVFNGGWVHSSTGAKPNGTTSYADSKFIISQVYPSSVTNIHVSYYSRTNSISDIMIGMQDDTVAQGSQVYLQDTGTVQTYSALNTDNNWVRTNNSSPSVGFYLVSRTSMSLLKGYKNGISVGSNTTLSFSSNLKSTLPIIIGGSIYKFNSTQYYYGNKESAFSSIGDGLTDGEAANFYTAIQKFNSTLGRQVGTPVVSDSDATAFISAAGITNNEQANAVNTLVTDLKTAGIWTKMKAIYPFVGGTATSHKFNLKDPRDLDAAFRLTFSGGWTHSSTGALPNGTTGYANTYLNPYVVFGNNQNTLPAGSTHQLNHMSKYIRNNIITSKYRYEGVFSNSGTLLCDMTIGWDTFYGPNGGATINGWAHGQPRSFVTLGNRTDGFFVVNRDGYASLKSFRNNTLISTNTTDIRAYNDVGLQSNLNPNQVFFIGARNDAYDYNIHPNNYHDYETAFQSIGWSLTDSENTAFYTAVQKFQTALGRQIGTPVLPDGQIAKLLDSYTGAAAAYSLRKLRTAYSGYAIRVRRSSDNLEQDISFKADGTLDTTSLLAFVGNGNGFVTTWYDQSGNARDAVQASSSWQPQIIISGVLNTYNSKVCVKFDGVDDYIQSPYYTGTSNELYFVTQTTDNAFLFPRGLTDFGFVAEQGSTSTQTSLYWTTQPQLYVNSALTSPVNRNDVYNLLNGYKLSVHKGANISTNFYYLRFGSYQQTGSFDFNGNLFEWIIYPTLQSSQTSIESNINSYYSIY